MTGPLSRPSIDVLRPRVQRSVQWVAGRSLNKAAVGMLRLGLPFPPYGPESALVMETFGRKSGRRRLTPMGCLKVAEDRLLVVAEHGRHADWVRNARAAGHVRIWLAGRSYQGRVRVLADGDPGAVLERMGNKVHTLSVLAMAHEPKVIEITLDRPASEQPSDAQ
ncbi:MAG TPA: nitroreductase family deazaflavin-dependent oxidoreductase [Actinomycetota bacterium]|nr:nitroreductase family deazaflavin-dependent oxidoreductase [Actinomycetota bacterium]